MNSINEHNSFTKEIRGKYDLVSLNDICTSITDCHHSTPIFVNQGYLVIRNFNIKRGRLWLEDAYYTTKETFQERISRSKPEPGDLIITREAPMGEVCIIPKDIECCLGQRMVLLKPNKSIVDNRYLLYAMLSQYVQSQINQSEGTGSIVSNLRIPVLKNIKIPLFDIITQSKIGTLLSTIDNKIEINNEIIKLQESIIKTLYDYWFVQFDFPNSEGNPYKSSGGPMIYSKEIKREIPNGWSVEKLTNVISWISGSQPAKSTFKHEMKQGYVRFIQNRDYASSEYLTFIKESNNNKICDEFDIMIDKYGDAAAIRYGLAGAYNVALSKIEVSLPFTQEYIRSYLKSEAIYNYLNKASIASTRASLSRENLEHLYIIIPDKSTLSNFESFGKNCIKQALINKSQNQKLSELRDWLLPMLMNGQVKVKDEKETELSMAAEPKMKYGK